MKKLNKTILIMFLIIMFCSGFANISLAGYQSRPGVSAVSNNAKGHFVNIRSMEESGGVLGLDAIIETPSYLDVSNDGKGNGLDCHFTKSTEWGTAVMLSASAYGSNSSSIQTTTGNATGLYHVVDNTYFYVSGIWDTTSALVDTIRNSDPRYYNLYSSKTFFPGEATLEYNHQKSKTLVSAESPSMGRGGDKGFGYGCTKYGFNLNRGRACIVNGEGF